MSADIGQPPPALEPCPFCGVAPTVRWSKNNPRASCKTPECWGGKLPVLLLDVPEFVEAWNTRGGVLQTPKAGGGQ